MITARMRPPSWLQWVAVAMALLPLLAACSSGKSSPLASPTIVTPTDILHDASLRLAMIPSARFSLDVQGDTYIDDKHTLRLLSASGELVRPNRVQTNFKVQVIGGLTLSMSLIIIGDQRWSTDLITGKWGPAPQEFGYDPSVLFDNQGGIGPVMNRIQGATMLANEDVRGISSYHFQARIDPAMIGQLSGGNLEGNPVTADLWIDRVNLDLLRVRLAEPPTITGRKPATWTIDLTDQGADLNVAPPD